MKLALIPPPRIAQYMRDTDYQLVLPSHFGIGNYDVEVRYARERGDFIILDNGVAEGLPLETEDDLYKLAKEYEVDEVVVPDVYGEMEPTLRIAKEWKYNEDFQHMAVVAAGNIDEARTLIDFYYDHPIIDCIGLPRLLLDSIDVGSRWYFSGYLHSAMENSGLQVHLLGTNPKFMEEMYGYSTLAVEGVRGVDTSAPFVYGMLDHIWPRDIRKVVHRGPGYTNIDSATLGNFTRKNIRTNIDYLKEKVYGTTAS